MRRALAGLIALVLGAGIVSALVAGDDGGPLEQADAERCGVALARHIGMDASVASARSESGTWRISVAAGEGALGLIVRPDGRVLEVAMIGPGGRQQLERSIRLVIFERGC